jgi:periplasmic protein TonB
MVSYGFTLIRLLESTMKASLIRHFTFGVLCAAMASSAWSATNLDEFRQEFAQAVYAASPELVHNRNPQALLRAVVVLNIKLGEGNTWVADVMRTNRDEPAMLARAVEAVKRVQMQNVPESLREELSRNGINETWLFDKDGSFQVMTLAKTQRNTL